MTLVKTQESAFRTRFDTVDARVPQTRRPAELELLALLFVLDPGSFLGPACPRPELERQLALRVRRPELERHLGQSIRPGWLGYLHSINERQPVQTHQLQTIAAQLELKPQSLAQQSRPLAAQLQLELHSPAQQCQPLAAQLELEPQSLAQHVLARQPERRGRHLHCSGPSEHAQFPGPGTLV